MAVADRDRRRCHRGELGPDGRARPPTTAGVAARRCSVPPSLRDHGATTAPAPRRPPASEDRVADRHHLGAVADRSHPRVPPRDRPTGRRRRRRVAAPLRRSFHPPPGTPASMAGRPVAPGTSPRRPASGGTFPAGRPPATVSKRGDLRHANGYRGEPVAHLPALLQLGLPQGVEGLGVGAQLGTDLRDVTVCAAVSTRAAVASARAVAASELVRAICSRSRVTSCSRIVKRASTSSTAGSYCWRGVGGCVGGRGCDVQLLLWPMLHK